MPKKGKKGKSKKKGKGKKKKTTTKEEEPKQEEPEIHIPEGKDWIIMSFCLVPWEAKHITMFLNFEDLVRTSMTIKTLKRYLYIYILYLSYIY